MPRPRGSRGPLQSSRGHRGKLESIPTAYLRIGESIPSSSRGPGTPGLWVRRCQSVRDLADSEYLGGQRLQGAPCFVDAFDLRQREGNTVRARILDGADGRRIGFRSQDDRDLESLYVAACLLGELPELRAAFRERSSGCLARGTSERHAIIVENGQPSITVLADPLEHLVAEPAQPHSRVRLGVRAGAAEYGWELEELAVEGEAILRPQSFHDLNRLHPVLAAPLEAAAGELNLEPARPACAESQDESPFAVAVQSRSLLRDHDGMLHRHDEHPGDDFERLCQGKSARGSDQWILVKRHTIVGRKHRLIERSNRVMSVTDPLESDPFRDLADRTHVYIGSGVARVGVGTADADFHATPLA